MTAAASSGTVDGRHLISVLQQPHLCPPAHRGRCRQPHTAHLEQMCMEVAVVDMCMEQGSGRAFVCQHNWAMTCNLLCIVRIDVAKPLVKNIRTAAMHM